MVCSRWPEPRTSKKKQKKQNCRPHVHRVRQEPQWGLQFCFFVFLDFRGFCMVCSRWPEPRKSKKNKKKIADHMSTESDKSPNGVCSFVFYFRCFCMVCSRWPEPRKSKKPKKNCRPHVHRVRQEPQWGLQFWFFWFFGFLDFRGFCMVCYRWPEPRKSKKIQKNKTADHMSTESDKSPNGVCSFAFWCFLDFRCFCMVCFAVYCCYHIKLPFTLRNPCRTLQNLARSKFSHLPPSPPALYLYIRIYLLCWSRWGGVWWDSLIIQFVVLKIFLKSLSSEEDGEYLNQEAGPKD